MTHMFTAKPTRPHSCLLLGTTKGGRAVAKQFPMWGQGAPIYFWPESGMVAWEDGREDAPPDRKYGTMTWQEAGRRVIGLSQMVFKSSEQGYYQDEANRLKLFVSDMEGVIRQAKEEGSPFDDGAAAEYKRRRPTTVVVPQIIDTIF